MAPAHTVWTIGHSNRGWSELLALLSAEKIGALADVRRFPASRRWPQFALDAIVAACEEAGLIYRHFPDLGGRRSKRLAHSPNTAWRVAGFAAYADYMLSTDFARAFDELALLAAERRTAVMCAEALPWQCHRRLIADQFVAQGWQVFDIVGPGQVREHALPPFASLLKGRVIYPGEPEQ